MTTVLGFKGVCVEFVYLFKRIHIVRVVSYMEEELLCFALVIKLLWKRWHWYAYFIFVVHYFVFKYQ